MSEVTLAEFLSLASDIGVIGLLIAVLWGGAKAFWVWGWSHRESVADLKAQLAKQEAEFTKREVKYEKEIAEWKGIAISATDIGARVTRVAEEKIVGS